MNERTGVLVFARYDSRRVPGKALRDIGGMALLERVIRRAQLVSLPVFLATTDNPSDDALVELADRLGVQSYRGPAEEVLERAVLAADAFGLEAFVRLCGDRPLFPIDEMDRAVAAMHFDPSANGIAPDLVTSFVPGTTVRGLTTEVIRTQTLRSLMDRKLSSEDQEHITNYFYDHPNEFRLIRLPDAGVSYSCPGFAVDTEADVRILNRIFAVDPALDLTPAQADRIYRS